MQENFVIFPDCRVKTEKFKVTNYFIKEETVKDDTEHTLVRLDINNEDEINENFTFIYRNEAKNF